MHSRFTFLAGKFLKAFGQHTHFKHTIGSLFQIHSQKFLMGSFLSESVDKHTYSATYQQTVW